MRVLKDFCFLKCKNEYGMIYFKSLVEVEVDSELFSMEKVFSEKENEFLTQRQKDAIQREIKQRILQKIADRLFGKNVC